MASDTSKAQLAAYVAAALVLLIGGAYLLRGEGGAAFAPKGAVALDGAGEAAGGTEPKPAAAARPGADLYVHVAGAVRRPGIYRVPAGSRVATAVRKAGGLSTRADLTAFNLASTVRDAQQVIVPKRGEAAAAAAAGGSTAGAASTAPGAPGQPISLSSATPQQLDELEGIGPKLAEAIISYRDQHHGFKSVDELREVDGIGEKRFATLQRAVKP